MKIEKHFMRISVIAFILALVPQISGAVLSSLYREIVDFLLAEFLSYFYVVVRYVITPILFFAVFYFIGKKPDFELELRPNLLALLIGNIASFFISSAHCGHFAVVASSICFFLLLPRITISMAIMAFNPAQVRNKA